MSSKALGILLILAGFLILLAFVGQGRDGATPIAGSSAGTALLPGLIESLNDVDQVFVDGGGGQRLVSLQRAGDRWNVTEAGGYPAERSAVNALLIALAEARIVEEKTADPEFYPLLGVEDIQNPDATGLKVTLTTSGGEQFEAVLGAPYGNEQVYARAEQAPQSALIDRNPEISRDPADWVVAQIISIASDRVQRVEITHADGEQLEIRKEDLSSSDFVVQNVPDDRELQFAGVASPSANLLQNLQLEAVRRQADDPSAPNVTSEFWMFDGLVITVSVNGTDEDAWLSFSARFDVEQALSFATESVVDLPADSDPVQSRQDDAMAEADELNLRLADWQYQIPSYQLSQLTRRMEDLLVAEVDE